MKSIYGKVEGLFINLPDTKVSEIRNKIYTSLEGIEGDKHYGFVRDSSGIREEEIYGRAKTKERIRVLNWRQWSAVSIEEMHELAENLALPSTVPVAMELASLVGANLCVSGIPAFSKITPTSILAFPGGTLWKVESETLPCIHPGHAIEKVYPEVKASSFPKAALHIRGLVGNVFLAGPVELGQQVELRMR